MCEQRTKDVNKHTEPSLVVRFREIARQAEDLADSGKGYLSRGGCLARANAFRQAADELQKEHKMTKHTEQANFPTPAPKAPPSYHYKVMAEGSQEAAVVYSSLSIDVIVKEIFAKGSRPIVKVVVTGTDDIQIELSDEEIIEAGHDTISRAKRKHLGAGRIDGKA